MIINRYDEYVILCDEFDEEPVELPSHKTDQDKYSFIPWALARWHDRAFKQIDPWRSEQSAIQVWS